MFPRPDDEDWARRIPDDVLRNASHEQPRHTSAAVRADDDNVGVHLFRVFHDLIGRRSRETNGRRGGRTVVRRQERTKLVHRQLDGLDLRIAWALRIKLRG
jgi:hypothetical protein